MMGRDIPPRRLAMPMRRGVLLALVLLVLPGCIGAEGDEGAADGADAGASGATGTSGDAANVTETVPGSVPPPALPVGRAWTYRATQLYNPDAEFKVVVARADDKGYHFAGGSEDDLVYHALWGSEWHGEHGRDLAPPDAWFKPFAWPLSDGKSWEYADGLTVTATAAPIMTPLGSKPGFIVEGESEWLTIRYEYAPEIGYYVRYEATWSGVVNEALELVRVEDNVTAWTWYELGPLAAATAPDKPVVFDVAAGWDAVIVSVGGAGGSRAAIVPPSGTAWHTEFPAEAESWQHAVLPSDEGKWVATVQGKTWVEGAPRLPGPWAWMHLAPVRWLPAGSL